ncbi:MAG: hypothetical protein QME81_14670 [bacterium]|nr:hypothetical protein [bacterium]
MMVKKTILGLAILVFISGLTLAEVPRLISLQGQLTDSSGKAISGEKSITFRIYDQATAEKSLWEESHQVNLSDNGVYSVILGETKSISLPFDKGYWLGIEVSGDEEMTPRRRLTSAGYAFRTIDADKIDSEDTSSLHDWNKLANVPAGFADGVDNTGAGDGHSLDAADGSLTDAVYVDNSGNVGIGTTSPGAKLDVRGSGGAAQCCAPVPPTVSLAEASNTAGRQAWLQFHNVNEAEAYIRLAGGGPAGSDREGQRRLEIGDHQGGKTGLTVAGNVGIGTTSPSEKFHLFNGIGLIEADAGKLRLKSTLAGRTYHVITDGGGLFRVFDENAEASRFTIDTNGKVGIGTTGPKAKLQVSATHDQLIIEDSDGATDTKLWLLNADGGNLTLDAANDAWTSWNRILGINRTGTTINKVWFPNGNVGIGTTDPEPKAKLQVSATHDQLIIEDSDGATDTKLWLLKADGGNLTLNAANDAWTVWNGALGINRTGTTINKVWFPNGNVGIGTTSPTQKLHVETTDADHSAGYFEIDNTNSTSDALFVKSNGTGDLIEAQSDTNPRFRVTNTGNVEIDGTVSSPCSDFAEMVEAEGEFEPGDVLVIGSEGKFDLAREPNSPLVCGIYSTKPGFIGGASMDEAENEGKIPMAVVGIVPCKVSVENGKIKPGDLLVTSSRPGYAMKGIDPRPGTILAKALESLDSDGIIKVIIMLQ